MRNETGTQRGTDVDRVAALVREGPIADAGPDMTVRTNQRIRFDGSGSTDADGAVNAFAWTFGDGGTGSGENPVHIFKRPGKYSVTLTITGEARGDCSPLDTDVAEIEVVPAPMHDIGTPERQATGLASTFTADVADLQGSTIVEHRWTFSDGTTGLGPIVEHAFAEPGEYFVDLETDFTGGDTGEFTLAARQRILVNDAPMPLIDGPTTMAAGQAVTFDGSMTSDSDGAIIEYLWDFGDGNTGQGVFAAHTYAQAGQYTMSLTVVDNAGVANSQVTTTRDITVNPAPVAGLQAPPPICPAVSVPWAVAADDSTEVNWRFGDGTEISGAAVSHAFGRPGLFPVTVALNDGQGLSNSQRSEEVYVRVNSAPTALAGPDQIACAGDTVVFDAGRSVDLDGQIIDWVWEFSDGVTLNGARVERVFDNPAALRVRLTVRDDSGSECAIGTDDARLLVNAPPVVDAGPDISVPVGAAHDVVRFEATSASDPDGQGLRISWDFGDGSDATGAVTRHRFAAPGSYEVTVKAEDTTGLTCGISTDTRIITAIPRP